MRCSAILSLVLLAGGPGCSSAGSASRLKAADFEGDGGAAAPPTATPVQPSKADESQQAKAPTTRPSDRGPVVSLGGYMILGTVIAEVNGRPIYADKVLAKLDQVFSLKAKELDPKEFRNFARSLIRQQVDEEIGSELEFAAAQRFTTDDDQNIASAYTAMWRQKQITRNGGSLAVTREHYLHPADPSRQGIDFDEAVKEQYRRYLVMIYLDRRVWPRVKVSAEDMRRFYDRYKDARFSVKSGVLFRVIEVNVRDSGGREEAARKIEGILKKVRRGDDFGLLASTYNDNKSLRLAGGYISVTEKRDRDGNVIMRHKDGRVILRDSEGYGVIKNAEGEVVERSKDLLKDCEPVREPQYITKGSMRNTKLEDAVFALNKPGEVTGIIDSGDVLCLAQLEDKRIARERSFDDESVQKEIRNELTSRQRLELRHKEQERLRKASVVQNDEAMLDVATAMAMQKYYVQNTRPLAAGAGDQE